MHTPRYLTLIVASSCALIAPLCPASQPLSPSQALSYVRISDLQFSPDGSRLAYVVASYQWDALPRVRITALATGETRELTPAQKSERTPQWAPDGKALAFLSNRDGTRQVYASALGADNVTALTSSKLGVEKFHWSPDGSHIAYLAKEDTAPDSNSGPQVADLDANLPRLWVMDVSSKTTRSLGKRGYGIEDFQWQDATHLLVTATDRPRVEELTNKIYRVATDDGTFTPLANPPQPFDAVLPSPDGKQFVVRSTDVEGPNARDLFIATPPDTALHTISGPQGWSVTDVKWHEPHDIWFLAKDGFYNRILHVTPKSGVARVELPLSVAAFDVSREGVLAFVGQDFAHLPEIYLRGKNGKIRQLSHIQQGWDSVALTPAEIFRTPTPDGFTIEAALLKPPGEKLPLVLWVHGGPGANFTAGYSWEEAVAQLLAAHGYQVLLVNPRGSDGYSEDFLKANRGDWGGGDYRDLMAVLDAVIARGATDPTRLGIGGWSYGGEMAVWAITQTNRFKAALSGAVVFNQQAEFDTEDNPADEEWYFGTPWERPEVFARNSPSTYIRSAHTPTLILAGENDIVNPIGQSRGLYRALKHLGVETEMVTYPGEGHSPRRGSYNVDMFERMLKWYDRYLKPAG